MNNTKRPFVVCHILASLDGRISGAFFGAPETAPAIKAYESLRSYYSCEATLYGTTTMLGGYSSGRVSALPRAKTFLPKSDWINDDGKAMGSCIVSVDPRGELAFSSHRIAKKGRPAAHVIQALTQQVGAEYLSYLRKLGVSYIFAGKEHLDCALLLKKLNEAFGVNRLMIAGGGVTNQSFLQEGLIDELSLVVAPVADGNTKAASIFERADFHSLHPPAAFTVKEVKTLDKSTLWLRYDLQR